MNKPQLTHRVAPEMVRDVLSQFRSRMLTADQAAARLGLSRSGLYKLYTRYLRAAADGAAATFSPAASGGDHAPDWPPEVAASLRSWLTAWPTAESTWHWAGCPTCKPGSFSRCCSGRAIPA